jgi:hypothetical protein
MAINVAAAHCEVMAQIYRIAYRKGGPGNNAEEPLCLGYAAFAVRELLVSLAPEDLPKTIWSAGVAVGFDSEDGLLLGRLGAQGLGPL